MDSLARSDSAGDAEIQQELEKKVDEIFSLAWQGRMKPEDGARELLRRFIRLVGKLSRKRKKALLTDLSEVFERIRVTNEDLERADSGVRGRAIAELKRDILEAFAVHQ